MSDSEERTVLSLAPDAIEMITTLAEQEPGDDEYGLYIEVTGIRGPQFTYDLSFMPVADASDAQIVERHGTLAVILRPEDVEKLDGASLSLSDEGLAMNNPNAPATPTMAAPKGDLTGPLADQIQTVIEQQVNPAIASHGGGAELVSVDGTIAYLKLMGGCQGCGMAQVTLRQGIERILMEAIPDLSGVIDVTDHASGTDPYYQAAKK
ncbi:MAG: NifU family protein [Acidimicrobiia bacterium]|nr:NifU family protein [Acidimicrobiia bacterium]